MPRPGPLQDIPIENFLTLNNSSTTFRPHKRPLSPCSRLSAFSPATKRRLIHVDGVFGFERSGSRASAPPPPPPFVHPRKLQFQNDAATAVPLSAMNVHSVAPNRAPTTIVSRTFEVSTSSKLSSTSVGANDHDDAENRVSRSPSPQPSPPLLCSTSQGALLSGDVRSMHYPGFQVYQDSIPVANLNLHADIDAILATRKVDTADKDSWKENRIPCFPGSFVTSKADDHRHGVCGASDVRDAANSMVLT